MIYIAPRALGVLAILFISIFALDVFQSGEPWHMIALGLIMHLLPSFVLVVMLAIAWRFERIGSVLFIAAGLAPVFLLSNPLWVNIILGGPFILTGLLFLFSYWWRSQRQND